MAALRLSDSSPTYKNSCLARNYRLLALCRFYVGWTLVATAILQGAKQEKEMSGF